MMFETYLERRVRRRMMDYFGQFEVESIQQQDEDLYMARLSGGGVAYAHVAPDGAITIREAAEAC